MVNICETGLDWCYDDECIKGRLLRQVKNLPKFAVEDTSFRDAPGVGHDGASGRQRVASGTTQALRPVAQAHTLPEWQGVVAARNMLELNSCHVETGGIQTELGVSNSRFLQNMSFGQRTTGKCCRRSRVESATRHDGAVVAHGRVVQKQRTIEGGDAAAVGIRGVLADRRIVESRSTHLSEHAATATDT